MQTFKRVLASLILMVAVLSANLPGVVQAAEKPKVLTTFYPVYYLAERIGGDRIELSMLLSDNQDAHDYESTAQDAVKVQDSDLFIYQDDEMEYFVKDLMTLLDSSQTKILESTQDLELLSGEGHDHAHEGEDYAHEDEDHNHESEDHAHEGHQHQFDPHTWLDPAVYAQQAENVKNALVEIDPDNAKTYEANLSQLQEELNTLTKDYQEQLSELKNRTFVVQHGAFGYLAHAFDLKQIAIAGLSSDQEPSAQQLASMQELLKEQDVHTIYVDPALDSKIAETVAAVTNADLLPLRTLEVVTAEESAAGEDYFTLMHKNLEQLIKN